MRKIFMATIHLHTEKELELTYVFHVEKLRKWVFCNLNVLLFTNDKQVINEIA